MEPLPAHIALLTDSPVFAGTERHIFDLACSVRPLVRNLSISSPEGSQLAQRSEPTGIAQLPLAPRKLIDRQVTQALANLLRAGSLDLLHAHNGRCCLQAAIAVRKAGRGRCVFTQHFLEPDHTTRSGLNSALYRLAHRWIDRRLDRIIAVSQAARDRMVARGDSLEDQIVVIPNGIPAPQVDHLAPPDAIRQELCIAADTPLLVCVARLETEKDLPTLIQAMVTLIRSIPNAVCVVAGEGEERKALEDQIRTIGLSGSVRLLGFREDAVSIVRAGDLFVLPSRAEPFGLAILEAMAVGKAVVATRAGGPVEIVEERVTGLLVTPGDPQEMAAALLALLQDAPQRTEMGRRGQMRFAQRFTSDRMAQATVEVYREALTR